MPSFLLFIEPFKELLFCNGTGFVCFDFFANGSHKGVVFIYNIRIILVAVVELILSLFLQSDFFIDFAFVGSVPVSSLGTIIFAGGIFVIGTYAVAVFCILDIR